MNLNFKVRLIFQIQKVFLDRKEYKLQANTAGWLNKSKSSILKNSQTFVCQEKWCFAAKSLDQFWEACPWLNQFSYSMAALTTNSQNYNLFNIFDQFTP